MEKFSWADPSNSFAFPVARPGYPIICAAAFVTLVFALLELVLPALACLAVTLFICFFFRDPDRVIPDAPGALVSPADGRIILIDRVDDHPFFEGSCLKISIFMSLFNVHVNRMPCDGRITQIRYRPGTFLAANRRRASIGNEQNALFLETEDKTRIGVVQIAGFVARRIICKVQQADRVIRGQRFGMICFGSRLDVYAPESLRVDVVLGDRVQAGTSILGFLP